MRGLSVSLFAVAFAALLPAGNAQAQRDLPLLPGSNVLPCPKHDGTRQARSDTARAGEWSASFFGTAQTINRTCTTSLELELARDGYPEARVKVETLSNHSVDIVDFSADRTQLALSRRSWGTRSGERDVDIAVLATASPTITWVSPWDLLGWGKCNAFVYPYGFLEDGKLVVIFAAPGSGFSRSAPNCLTGEKIFAFDLVQRSAVELSAPVRVQRYGSTEFTEARSCSNDPDVTGACFSFRGRLSLYNGSPTVRIWRIGTKRILGLRNDFPLPYPNWTDVMSFDNQMFANFTVCPLTPEKPGHMQMICVESMDKVSIVEPRDHVPFATRGPGMQ